MCERDSNDNDKKENTYQVDCGRDRLYHFVKILFACYPQKSQHLHHCKAQN